MILEVCTNTLVFDETLDSSLSEDFGITYT
jgi:hypothetical protein